MRSTTAFMASSLRSFKIDPSQQPARIVDVIRIHRQDGNPAQKLDLEGITLDGKGGFYVASEGRTDRVIPHAIYHVSADGLIKDRKGEIGLPPELMAVEKRFGFEGITKRWRHPVDGRSARMEGRP